MISFINPEDKEFLTYKTSISQFSALLGIDKKSSMREIDIIVSRLLSRVITIETPNGWKKYQWVSYAEADKKEDFLLLRFHDKLKPFLLELKTRFTSFKIKEVVDLKSVYSIRIYQLIKDYNGKKITNFVYTVNDLRSILLGEKSKKYPVFTDFKKNILMVAERELKEKSAISFSFKTIRVGRSIGKIEFTIIKKSQPKTTPSPALPPKTDTEQDESQPPEVQEMFSIGIAKNKAISLLDQYGAEYITEKLKITIEKERPNPAGFFIKAVAEDWKSKAEKKKRKEDQARQKRREERRVERLNGASSDLEKTFRIKQKKEFLSSLTENQAAELLQEAKKELPEIADMIKAIDSPLCGAFVTSKIPDYEANKQLFINTELQKMGLINGDNQDTAK
jgi:plasmid replication initiation protein